MAVKSPAVKEILERYRTIWALNHAQSLMGWDREVYMPEEGIGGRSLAASEIAKLTQKLMLDESFVKLIDKAKEEDLTDVEKGMIRMLERDLKFYRKGASGDSGRVRQDYQRGLRRLARRPGEGRLQEVRAVLGADSELVRS
jgi:carboxypeptidase Pfu. Metallo peptidase. MEROPS family M32